MVGWGEGGTRMRVGVWGEGMEGRNGGGWWRGRYLREGFLMNLTYFCS